MVLNLWYVYLPLMVGSWCANLGELKCLIFWGLVARYYFNFPAFCNWIGIFLTKVQYGFLHFYLGLKQQTWEWPGQLVFRFKWPACVSGKWQGGYASKKSLRTPDFDNPMQKGVKRATLMIRMELGFGL